MIALAVEHGVSMKTGESTLGSAHARPTKEGLPKERRIVFKEWQNGTSDSDK